MATPRALIISISSDIGTALTRKLLAKGWEVAGTLRTATAETSDLAARGAHLFTCDLAQTDAVVTCCASIRKSFPSWDFLIVAPGTQEPVGPFSDTNFTAWTQSISLNFTQQLNFVHTLLPTRNLACPNGPCVLFFAGGGTNGPTVRYSAYTVSKIALIKMCELLHAEIDDTRFAIIGPGWVKTKIHQATIEAGSLAGENYEQTQERFKHSRFVPMEKVIKCCEWVFASPRIVVSGRNFSAASDHWGDPTLSTQLADDPHMYRLRRSGNDWKPSPPANEPTA